MLLEPTKPFSESTRTYETARILLLGIPLDVTVTFRPGTRFAPSAIREISWHLEDYNYLTDEDIRDVPFFDMGDLRLTGDLDNNLNQIRSAAKEILDDGRVPLFIGGEHLITLPIIQAISEYHPDLNVIVFDAHTDLSDSYRKTEQSHANLIRLVYDIVGNDKIFIFGTRMGTKDDRQFMEGRILSSYEPPFGEFLERLKNEPVYISIDVDILDPSIAPGVSTPELLGWRYEGLNNTIRRFTMLNKIIGADIVEISPNYDLSGITTLVGARLVREMLFLINRRIRQEDWKNV